MTRQELIKQEEEFFEIQNQILEEAKNRHITLRILGAIAIRNHCPEFKYLEYDQDRSLFDIDFAGYSEDAGKIAEIFLDFGYKENQNVKYLFGTQRRIFYHHSNGIVLEVFLDKLRFCHDINLKGRLSLDNPTISLVDLLLGKLQIVEINEKDILDSIVLIREHDIGESEIETINIKYLSTVCSSDWGLWKTVITNLEKLKLFIPQYIQNQDGIQNVTRKIESMLDTINAERKTVKWHIRSWVGDKMRWYKEVEEIDRG